MAFEAARRTLLLKEPSLAADILLPIEKGSPLTSVGKIKEIVNGVAWLNVSFTPPGGTASRGWVLEEHCTPINTIPRPEVQIGGFVRTSLMLEHQFNSMDTTGPWFASAELIISRAIIETGLSNSAPRINGSDSVGPLQVSSKEWKSFIDEAGNFAKDFDAADSDTDRDNPQQQIYAAVFRMHADGKSFSKLKEKKGVNFADRDFLPSHLDLFHAYILESPSAAFAIDEVRGSDDAKAKKIEEILKNILKSDQIDRLFATRSEYLGTRAASKTVSEFVEVTEKKLDNALKEAVALIERHAPDELPTEPDPEKVVIVPVDPGNVAQVPSADRVEFAVFGASVKSMFWPVITTDQKALIVSYQTKAGKIIGRNSRKFFADRRAGRHHVGLDLFCTNNEVVVACADGKIVSFFRFYKSDAGEITFALFIEHDGVVINYGEVKANAPNEFGWRVGDSVTAGQKIARVSTTNMIHFETYIAGTRENSRWFGSQAKPSRLRNPTLLLLNLAANGTRIHIDGAHSGGTGGSGETPPGNNGSPVPVDDEDILTLARTIFGEARGEKKAAGREAVAHVVINRQRLGVMSGKTIAKTCRRKSQFSCWNPGNPNLKVIENANRGLSARFNECLDIAERVINGQLADNTSGATHYYNFSMIGRPKWAKVPPAIQTVEIGNHRFFRDVP